MQPIKHVKEDKFELTVTLTNLSYKSGSGELTINPYDSNNFFYANPGSVLYECYETLRGRPEIRFVNSDRSSYIESVRLFEQTGHELHLIAAQIAEWFGLYDFEKSTSNNPNGPVM